MIGCFFRSGHPGPRPFKSSCGLEAENAVLRHQLIVVKRRLMVASGSRTMIAGSLSAVSPVSINPEGFTIIQPETSCVGTGPAFAATGVGSRAHGGGRPQIDTEMRVLIRRMSVENPLWAARIHGELLKLGLEIAPVERRQVHGQTTGATSRDGEPSCATTRGHRRLWTCSWFNDRFRLLYALVIVPGSAAETSSGSTSQQIRRQNGLPRQITEAFPWDEAPHYLIRDRDRIYGSVVTRRLRAMGIRDKPTAPASPGQNGIAERLIGSIRRECVDHMIVLGECICVGF